MAWGHAKFIGLRDEQWFCGSVVALVVECLPLEMFLELYHRVFTGRLRKCKVRFERRFRATVSGLAGCFL